MQQARRAPTHMSLAIRLPVMLLRWSFLATPVPPWPCSDCSPLMLLCIRIRLHHVQPANAETNVAGDTIAEETVIGSPTRLDCRHQLQRGQWCRRFSLLRGAGAQDVCAITHPKSPWPVYPFLSVLSFPNGRSSSEQIRCSSYSSVWKRSAPGANASVDSGGTQSIEQLWEEYFADASQWWDNRAVKKSPRSPDLQHKVTKKALWIDGWSTPAWVKARLTSVTQGGLQCHADFDTKDSQDTAEGKRLPMSNNGEGNTPLTGVRELTQIAQGSGGTMHVRSARSTIEAIDILKNRLQEGTSIESYTYVEVLKRCLKQKDLLAAKQVHDCIIQNGMEQNIYVANNLLSVYVRCGRLQDARRVFDGLVKKDCFSWNIMIGGYAQRHLAKDALDFFDQMRQDGVQPTEITYLSILKACASPPALKWGKKIHAYIRHDGLESDVRVGTALLNMYAKCGCIKEARETFDELTNRDVFAWNVMIGAYAGSGFGEEAYQHFLKMKLEGLIPNAFTFSSILNACASAGALEWVKEVHSHALEAGFASDLCLGNALVHVYAKSGSIDDAQLVFDMMDERDVITWTAMIGGLAQHGRGHEALEVFRSMTWVGVKPDSSLFVVVLSACSHAGLVDDGRRLFLAMTQNYGIEPTVVHCTCMVDLLGRAGHLEEAKLFIDNMPVEPDGATWGALLGACRTYGNVELAELAAKERLKLERNHAGTYVLLSNIYAAAGKWEEVSLLRSVMQERGIRKEPGRSWIEVDNKIHHFVVGDASHPEAKEIYAELNRLTKRIKAEGYIPDTRLVLQNIDEGDKELALCSHSEKLAITYGLMHTPKGKPIRVYKNLRVCSDCHAATKFISKVTGREIVARDANRFHHFKDGLCSCGDYW